MRQGIEGEGRINSPQPLKDTLSRLHPTKVMQAENINRWMDYSFTAPVKGGTGQVNINGQIGRILPPYFLHVIKGN